MSELRVVHVGQPSQAALQAAANQLERIRQRAIQRVVDAATEQGKEVTKEFIAEVLGLQVSEVVIKGGSA